DRRVACAQRACESQRIFDVLLELLARVGEGRGRRRAGRWRTMHGVGRRKVGRGKLRAAAADTRPDYDTQPTLAKPARAALSPCLPTRLRHLLPRLTAPPRC